MNGLNIAVFGGLGALARYGVGAAFLPAQAPFPLATLTVNILGCFLLGLCSSFIQMLKLPEWLKSGFQVGFIGSFTTFSTFSVEIIELMDTSPILAYLYLMISIAGSLTSVWLGHRFGHRISPKRGEDYD